MESKTIWMGNIESHMTEPYLRNFFSDDEGLAALKLMKDKVTGGLAGYAFIEFTTTPAAKKFLEKYNNRPMPGSSAPFRLNWAQYSGNKSAGPEYSLFIGDISNDVTEAQITSVFRLRYPSVTGMKIVNDPISGISKGYGFIKFGSEREASVALDEMQGVYIGSKPIRMSKAAPKRGAEESTETSHSSVSSTSIDWTQYLYHHNTNVSTVGMHQQMDPSVYAHYDQQQKCYTCFSMFNQYPQSSDPNFFTKQHDTYTDNASFVTDRVNTLISELSCSSLGRIQQ
jgi:RNA recognition motif-containing protein